MSLLLDALKKSGDSPQKGTGLSDLTLEEHTPPSRSAGAESTASTAPSRAAGETLFAAKKKKASSTMRWKLGLVPTTLIICSVIGAGYGYYVWLELQPPSRPGWHNAPLRRPRLLLPLPRCRSFRWCRRP